MKKPLTLIERIADDMAGFANMELHFNRHMQTTHIRSRYLLDMNDLLAYGRSSMGLDYINDHSYLLPTFPCAVSDLSGSELMGGIITSNQLLLAQKTISPSNGVKYTLVVIANYEWDQNVKKYYFNVLGAFVKLKGSKRWEFKGDKEADKLFKDGCRERVDHALSLFMYYLGNYIHCYLGTEIHEVNHKQRVIRQISKSSDEIEKPLPDVIYRVIDRVKHVYPNRKRSSGHTATRPQHRVHVDSHKRRLKDNWIGHDFDGNVCLGETHVHEHWRYMENPEIPIITIKKPLKIDQERTIQ